MAYLFVCLMHASIGQSPFSLKLPNLIDPDSNSCVELLLLTLPGQLLFVLAACFIHRPALLSATFIMVGGVIALGQCLVFAEVFGNTWSLTEVVRLFGFNLQYLLLALIPGVSLLLALEHWRGQRLAG